MADEKNTPRNEELTADVQAFCHLIARILMRCLREKDPGVLHLLADSSSLDEQGKEIINDSAA